MIEAEQYDGSNNPFGVLHWQADCPFIATLEGSLHVSVGDYVVRGAAGEFYPCKSEIFLASYEPLVPRPIGLTERKAA
ncbi:MAG: hypothetical protein ACRDNW_28565 [Trebonia sp.]